MLPAFGIEGGILLALTRAVAIAGLLSLFGSLVFRSLVAPRAFKQMSRAVTAHSYRLLMRLTQLGAAVSVLGLLAWLVVESGSIANARSVSQALAAVPTVLVSTYFGHLIAYQIVAVLVTAAVVGRQDNVRRQRAGLAISAVALGLQAGHSHAAAMYSGPSLLLVSGLVHLFGAGAWLGGLLPLLLVVRNAPAQAGALAARWFSPIGKLCLVALTASALFQGWILVDSLPGLVGTSYGWTVLVKLSLFGVLFAFALANRYRFAPALLHSEPVAAKRVLVRSIALQTGFGLAIVVAASVLSSLPPAMHEQPLWPFPDRFTLETIDQVPEFRQEVMGAILALGGAAVLLVIAVPIRRIRWAAIAAATVITSFAVPHLDLLFVPAYPTSFYRSPTNFAATSIVRGAALFPEHCASCHGDGGRGDGPAAKDLLVPPADLTAAHLWAHSDGELFWWLTHGIEAPKGGLGMPSFATALSDDDRWHLIDYIRAYNAGVKVHAFGSWSPPVQAPELQANCADNRTVSIADLRGVFIRLVIGLAKPTTANGVTTILATNAAVNHPSSGVCVASDEGLTLAYAIVSGIAMSELPGTEFLIDGDGWLRAVQRSTEKPRWNDPRLLAADIQNLESHPIAGNPRGSHAHMQM